MDARHNDCLISPTDTDAEALFFTVNVGSGEVRLRAKRALAVSAARLLSAAVGVGGAAPFKSVLGSLESDGGAELAIGSNADYESRS